MYALQARERFGGIVCCDESLEDSRRQATATQSGDRPRLSDLYRHSRDTGPFDDGLVVGRKVPDVWRMFDRSEHMCKTIWLGGEYPINQQMR